MYRSPFSIRRLAAVLTTLAGFCCTLTAGPENLIINEIQVANIDMFIDPSFNYGGWIEIFNPTDEDVNLFNCSISDDPNDPTKFKLPSGIGTVKAGGFMNIWFDHNTIRSDTRYSTNAYKQVPFKLNSEGGTIYLYTSSQELIDSQSYPPAVTRCSYARTVDGAGTWSYTSTPTPAASNAGSTFASEQLPALEGAPDGTVFTDPFYIEVKIPEGAFLVYTTDGSTPTLENGIRNLDGRLPVINKTTVFRFRLFRDGFLPSPVVTRSYIYKDRNYYLPIVSVATDAKNLYDNRIGVYVDGTNGTNGNNKDNSNKNRAWERPVNFEYLMPDEGGDYTTSPIQQETDFEVAGGWSRHFAPSSFRLKAAKQYEGQNFLPYPFFQEKPYIKHKAVQVRNGGNDHNCRIIDAGIQECILRSGFNVDGLSVQPVHVFFNGVFQYTYNMRETSNKNFSYSNYGIDKDEIDEFEINGSKGYEQKSGDNKAMLRWIELSKNLGDRLLADTTYKQICQLVDIDEYCNYMAAECYIGSSDWLTNCNNVKGFRSRADGGKFHLVMIDLDAGFQMTNMVSRLPNSLNDSRYSGGQSYLIAIHLNMLKHLPYRKRFIDTYCIVDGSVFEPERCSAIIQELANRTNEALSWEGKSPWGSANSLISTISNNSNRNARISALSSYFQLGKGYPIQISSNIPDAKLLINNIDVPTGRFNGTLFAPAIIEAKAPAGYRFSGWRTNGEYSTQESLVPLNDTWSYYDQGSLDDKNWNTRVSNVTNWKKGQAPFGYGTVGIEAGAGDYTTELDYGGNSSNKRPTYYFRKSFQLNTAPTENDVFRLTYYVDDGVVIYINGTELTRYHMPEGTPTYNTYSTTYEGSQAYSTTLTIPNELLRSGTNSISAEVHNTSASSSDIYWGATITKGTYKLVDEVAEIDIQDIADPGVQQAIIAVFEKLPDEELLADIANPIRINEVSAGNTVFINEYFKKNDWFELYNTTDHDLDAAGLYLSDDPKEPNKYQIPTTSALNTIVPAHGFLTVWADDLESLSQLHTPFKLGNKKGEQVRLTSSEEFVERNAPFFIDHPELKEFADALVYNSHKGDESVGRYPDGANTFYHMHRPTIGFTNTIHTFDVVIGTDKGVTPEVHDMVEMEQAEPSAVIASDVLAGYYNLNGHYLGRDFAALRPGLYIVRLADGSSKKVVKK